MKPGYIYEMQRAMSPSQMHQSMLANASGQQNAAAQLVMYAQQRMLLASMGYEHFKCARCGDEVETRVGIVDAEIDHALHGCNGPLYEAR